MVMNSIQASRIIARYREEMCAPAENRTVSMMEVAEASRVLGGVTLAEVRQDTSG